MDYAMNRPWWAMMNDEDGARDRRHDRERDHRRGRHHSPGGEGPANDFFGPDGFFGPRGFFGPQGPFGPNGPFDPDGPFGHGRGRGGHGRRGGRARRGDVRLAILALLAEEPMNGYQMIQALDERTGGLWKPSPGAVYPALAQLSDEGLVEQVHEQGRQAYRLTDAGHAAAAEITEKPWESVQESAQAWIPDGGPALWKELGQLAAAAKAVLGAGDAELAEEATRILKDARRRLYGLLAEDAGDDA